MTFDHLSLLLVLLLLPGLWLWMRAQPSSSQVCVALKCAACATLVLALAGPTMRREETKLAITVLLDTSASMPAEARDRAEGMLRDLVRQRSEADLNLITFGVSPRLWPVSENPNAVTIPRVADGADATDVEAALQLAVSTFPSQGARRVLLISDGNETHGDALSAALRARDQGVSIFTVPFGGSAALPVRGVSIDFPQNVFSGEHFTVSLKLDSERAFPSRVWATARGHEIGATTLDLQAGVNSAALNARIVDNGVIQVDVHISSGGAQQVLLSQAITVDRPRVLYISGDDSHSAPLLQTLKKAEVDVQTATAFPVAETKRDWNAVVLDNYPTHRLSAQEEAAVERYVSMGGGLIFIAGDKNSLLARVPMTPFEKVLPVRSLPPPEKPAAIVLVLDRSGSMQGQPIEMVRYAARSSIVELRPVDMVGVISFNETFNWVVPMGTATDLQTKADLINQINADGDTDIYSPMTAALQATLRENVSSRHIILLTDGDQTKEAFQDFPKLEHDAVAQHVTISTIGVGFGVNHQLLDALAHQTGGKSYFVSDTGSLPEILNAEVRSVDEFAIQERPVHVERVRPATFTDGIDFGQAPQLLGFVQSEARDGAETILRVDKDKPLLVRWNYGLGYVVAFMSDAKGRWAAPWVKWNSFGTLWSQIVRSASSHRDEAIRAGVRPSPRQDEMIVWYEIQRQANHGGDPALADQEKVLVAAPDGTRQEAQLSQTGPGHYDAHITVGPAGLYRVTSGNGVPVPQVGFYYDAEERKPKPVNLALLSDISRVTGGRVYPSLQQLLSRDNSLVSQSRPLWPYFLLLALAINFVELALRKGFFKRAALPKNMVARRVA